MNHRPAAQADGAAVAVDVVLLLAHLRASACRAGVTSSIKHQTGSRGTHHHHHLAARSCVARDREEEIVRIRSDVTATHREILASTRCQCQCQQANLWPVVEASSRRDWSPRSRPSPALLAWLLRRPAVWPRVTVTVDHQTLTVWRGGRWCG